MGVFFVGGVHSVGKSTSCANVSHILDVPHFSAGQIIREERHIPVTANKKVADVKKNQEHLITGTRKILRKSSNIILDGHFTLVTTENTIEQVPIDVFQSLDIKRLIIVIDSPEAISERRFERDAIIVGAEQVKLHQDAEISYATHVAETLQVPLLTVEAFSDQIMTIFLSEYMEKFSLCNQGQ